MRQENLALSVTPDTIRKRDTFEIIYIINPSSTGITAYVNLRGGPATSADAPIGSGQGLVITLGESDVGASIVAASATPTVILLRESFQSQEAFLIFGPVFIAAAAQFAAMWFAASATQLQPVGPFTGARLDTARGIAAAGAMTLGVTGNATFGVPFLMGSSAGDYAEIGTNGWQVINAGSIRLYMDNTSVLSLRNGYSFVQHFGAGTDPRHTIAPTQQVLHTPVAGGAIQSLLVCYEFPVANGSTVTAGDIVEFNNNANNRISSSAAGSVQIILGIAQTTATGNAGGTVFARVAVEGWVTGTIADTGGVTVLQYIKPGTTTANKVNSTAALAVNSFGRCTLTATATNPTSYMICRA